MEIKQSETQFGQDMEIREADFWFGHGCAVERQSTKAPFDLLVNGHRVDVKAAHLTSGRAYVFAGLRRGIDCDFFDLICLDDNDRTRWRFVVPASAARVETFVISCGSGTPTDRHLKYLDAIDPLLNPAP